MLQAQEVSQEPHYLPPVVAPKGVACKNSTWGSFTILEEGRGYKIKQLK